MNRQICSIKQEDVATVRPRELLTKLELEDLKLSGLVQSEQHVIYRLMEGGGGGGGAGRP